SVVTRSGVTPVTAFADRKKALAAARSRCSLSITSTRAPARSIARYRYRQPPRTRMYVSSTYQLRPALPRRRRRRFSANAGVSLDSQSRTASYDAAEKEHLAQIPQARLVAQAPEHHEGDDVGGELCPVQGPTAALIELLTAAAAEEPA